MENDDERERALCLSEIINRIYGLQLYIDVSKRARVLEQTHAE